MARARNIKPGFFRNENLVELPYETRLLFIGLWTIADREGRLEDRPKRIKMELFPADDLNVDSCLQQLHDAGFIIRYAVADARYIQVANFGKHQNPHHKEQESTIPAPDGYAPDPVKDDANPGHAPDMPQANPGHAVLDSLNTDSPFSDTGNPKQSPSPKSDGVGRESPVERRFEAFWTAYPRRVGKADALKAWKRIKPNDELAQEMIAAIERQSSSPQWLRDGGQYIPHPSTWLNQGRWEDEVNAGSLTVMSNDPSINPATGKPYEYNHPKNPKVMVG